MADFTIKGLDDVLYALANLPDSITKNAAPFAMRKGAAVIAAEAKRRAPILRNPTDDRTVGLIRDQIAVRKRKRKPAGIAIAYSVGVLGGAALTEKSTKKTRKAGSVGKTTDLKTRPAYWRFLEFGTEKQKSQPFLRPSLDAKAGEAIDAIAEGFRASLARAVTKALKA